MQLLCIDRCSRFALNADGDVRAPSVKARMNLIKEQLQQELRDAGWHSRGYLPHFDGGEIAQTITFRLADSLPQVVLERWKRELVRDIQTGHDSVLRKRIEAYLDQGYGSCALRNATASS